MYSSRDFKTDVEIFIQLAIELQALVPASPVPETRKDGKGRKEKPIRGNKERTRQNDAASFGWRGGVENF